jgi:hypothetical protein
MPACRLPLVALLAAALAAPAARAQAPAEPAPAPPAGSEWERVPPPGEPAAPAGEPAAAPAEPAAEAAAPTPAAPPRTPPLRLVAQVGWDYGSDELVETTGDGRSLRAGGGSSYAVGLAFLPLLDGRLHTQATIGLKYDLLRADNGDASYVAFPLEVMEFLTFHPFRIGLGLNVNLFGRVSIDTDTLDDSADLEPGVGLVAQADLVWRFRGAPRGFLTVGPRVVLQELDVEGGGSVTANAYGASLGFTF